MAEQYITKTSIRKVKETNAETGETEVKKVKEQIKYRIDAEFVPTAVSEISQEFIENYCVAKKETAWLVSEVTKTITDKAGKVRDYPFVSLRADFAKKFFPHILGNSKVEKKPTWKDKILAKYGKSAPVGKSPKMK